MTKHFNWWVLSSVQASIEMKSQAIIFDVTLHTVALYRLFQRSQQKLVLTSCSCGVSPPQGLIFHSAFGLIKKFLLKL